MRRSFCGSATTVYWSIPCWRAKGELPALRIFDGQRQRNPVIDLPPEASSALESVTHCLITHCQKGHFDHLDREEKKWLRERRIPVICTPTMRAIYANAASENGKQSTRSRI
ncbi:hypothetical protein ACFOFO_10600 [Undibacterium arcticum]|uniref:Zn-dependent hydrolase n=1 Tax=Undibacterium arcticum TaxID=1762892 RepID=A0ABV7F3X6_9BURK